MGIVVHRHVTATDSGLWIDGGVLSLSSPASKHLETSHCFPVCKKSLRWIYFKQNLPCLARVSVGLSPGQTEWLAVARKRKLNLRKSSQVNASARKAWPNGVAIRPKFSTCVYLRLRLARALGILREKWSEQNKEGHPRPHLFLVLALAPFFAREKHRKP